MDDLLQLQQEFTRRGVLISFNGSLTNSIIEEMGNAIRKYLENKDLEKGTISDVFAVYIEQTQNIGNYLRKRDPDATHRISIVLISNVEGNYLISSGNYIRRSDVPALQAKLELVSTPDYEHLKQLYKEQRRRPLDKGADSAGLGLIDIARRAMKPIEFRFDPVDEEYEFFSLIVTLKGVER